MGKVKNILKTKKKWIVIGVIAIFVLYQIFRPRSVSSYYEEKEVGTQDIVVYNSFVGNVTPGKDQDIIPTVSSTVTEVYVSKGDEVKKGDVIAQLDTSTVEYNISVQQSTLNQTAVSNSYTIAEAERQYSDFKEQVDTGLNSSMQAAQSQLDSAWQSYQTAQTNYDNAVNAINAGTYSDTYDLLLAKNSAQSAKDSAQSAYDAAVNQLNSLKADLDTKLTAYNEAKDAYEATVAGGESQETIDELEQKMNEAETAMNNAQSAYDTYNSTANISGLKSTLDSANSALTQATVRYDNAVNSVLSNLKSALDSACQSYNTAYANAESTWLSITQQLDSYSASVDRARATSNTATSQLELNHLKDSLSDYTITAPCDGVITSLTLSEGSMATGNTAVGTISDLNSMMIDIKVDEYSILNTTEGSDVTVYIDSIGKSYNGTISYIAPTATINNGVSYYEAEVTFTGDSDVRSGMSVEVRLTTTDLHDVVALSSSDISYHDDHTAYVLVNDEDGNVAERSIEIGASDGTYTEITSGLEAGDTILVIPSAYGSFTVSVEE